MQCVTVATPVVVVGIPIRIGRIMRTQTRMQGHIRTHLDIPFAQCIVDNVLVLLHHDAAGGICDVASSLRVRIDKVYCS